MSAAGGRRKWRNAFAGVDVGDLLADVLAPDRHRGGDLRWAPAPAFEVDVGIVTMQLRLMALGLYAGGADGRISEPLRASLRRFQLWAGLRQTGDVHDPATRLRLRDEVRAAALAGATPAGGLADWPR
jgi:hypothetical protein